MSEHPRDELKTLRGLLSALESGEMTLRRAGKDVTLGEAAILKREISHLEEIIVDLRLKMARNA